MEIVDLLQGSQEWVEFRKTHIGASDAPIICGVDPYTKPLQLWEEKIGSAERRINPAMRRGSDLEPKVRELVERDHERSYPPTVVKSDEYEFMIASLDGYDFASQKFIEIKCPNADTFEKISFSKEVPIHWNYQMQHQMCATGLSECSLIVSDGYFFTEIVVKRDQSIIDELIAKEKDFYQSMLNFEQPKGDIPERSDEEAIEAIEAFIKVDEAFEEIKELREIHRQALIYVSKGESFRCKGKTVVKIIKEGPINYKKIEALKDIDLSKYRGKPIEYWRVT